MTIRFRSSCLLAWSKNLRTGSVNPRLMRVHASGTAIRLCTPGYSLNFRFSACSLSGSDAKALAVELITNL
jgi:hypothetical protein